ncbi:MAG: outer membrane beta-barrel protein, partial [Owenweeksia sp.]
MAGAARYLLIILTIFSGLSAFAQNRALIISGTVRDAQSGEPVPYATVALASENTGKIFDGTTTDDDGSFRLGTDSTNFYVEVSFIGYQKKVIRNLNPQNGQLRLGVIELGQETSSLEEVEVTAERSVVEFKLDKRVFNVGKDISSTGMGALEVLNNVPSVNVNIEGEISLRGNSGVQILINGKPSVLSDEGSNALGTLTADMIESIEVITNPSAKYEAGGTSGIINIILKKEEKKGFNGSVSANTGIPDNHSIGISLNRRTENFNIFSQLGAGYRSMPSYDESENRNLQDGTRILSDGVDYRNETFYNVILGTDYYINETDVITLSGNFAYELESQPSETDFEFYDASGALSSAYQRKETTSATNPKYQYDLQYKKQFKSHEDHALLFSTLGSFFGKELSSNFENVPLLDETADPDQKTETNFFQRDYTFKLDYTNPLNDKFTIESGAQYEINDVGNDYTVLNEQNGVFVADSGLTNNFEYKQKVLGVYGTGSYEREKWGVKLGLRVENTDLQTILTTTNESNHQNYTNFFPTV